MLNSSILSKGMLKALANFNLPRLPAGQIQRRELHSFEGRIRPEVVIGSNAMLFATLLSVNQHRLLYGAQSHSQLKVIAAPFWLDSTHPDHEQKLWGQTMLGLPRGVRELFSELFPQQNAQQYITWAQYKILKQAAITLLQDKFAVPVYSGTPQISALSSGAYNFTVQSDTYQHEFTMPKNVFVYDWHRIFKTDAKIASQINQSSHSILYTIPASLVPKEIIILGDGESVLWLAHHFPNTKVYYLSKSNSNKPLQKFIKPSHGNIKLDNTVFVPFNSADDSHYEKLNLVAGFNESGIKSSVVRYVDATHGIDITAPFFVAIGFKHANYTTELPANNVLRLSDQSNSEFIAPRNVPSGSLMDSLWRIRSATKNLDWSADLDAFRYTEFVSFMQQWAQQHAIPLNEAFVKHLAKYLKGLSDPPNETEYMQIMLDLFKQHVSNDEQIVQKFASQVLELTENASRMRPRVPERLV